MTEQNGSGPLTYRAFMDYMEKFREEIVTRETCKARHQWLDASKLWIAIGTIGVLQLLQLMQLAQAIAAKQ